MRKTPEDFFDLKKNGLLMQAGKMYVSYSLFF